MLPGIEPVEVLEVLGRTIRRQPPVVVQYCRTPRSGRASWPCGYRAASCHGQANKCPTCAFSYCDHHLPLHVTRLYVPPDAWNTTVKRLLAAMEACARNGGRTPIRAPQVVVEDG